MLSLSGFAIGVAAITLGFASRLILDHTGSARFIGCLPCFGPGARCCRDPCLPLFGFCLDALALLSFRSLPRRLPLLAGGGQLLTFRLAREPCRFCSFLRGSKGLKLSGPCACCCVATLGKLFVSGALQISVPVAMSSRQSQTYLARFATSSAAVVSLANRASRSRNVFSALASALGSSSSAARPRVGNCDWTLPKAVSARWRDLLCISAMFVLASQPLGSASCNKKGQAKQLPDLMGSCFRQWRRNRYHGKQLRAHAAWRLQADILPDLLSRCMS
jgi:hypothetical protein